MSGSLIKIDEEIITSATASVTLGGSDWDSSYDVYMLKIKDCEPSVDNVVLQGRFTEGGVENSSANYDMARKVLQANATFLNLSLQNYNEFFFNRIAVGTGGGETLNGVFYIFNANNSSEYTFMTIENVGIGITPNTFGEAGGVVLTSQTQVDGVKLFFQSSANIQAGATFTLYGLKK